MIKEVKRQSLFSIFSEWEKERDFIYKVKSGVLRNCNAANITFFLLMENQGQIHVPDYGA